MAMLSATAQEAALRITSRRSVIVATSLLLFEFERPAASVSGPPRRQAARMTEPFRSDLVPNKVCANAYNSSACRALGRGQGHGAHAGLTQPAGVPLLPLAKEG
jgi:hypothetical protein